jgi:glutamate/tyrosine decarboxylase-like PLP-dependent enzyme
MNNLAKYNLDQTLDPSNWEPLNQLGHTMVDDALRFLEEVRLRPVWQKTPESTKDLANQPLPMEGTAPEEIYADFLKHILPYTKGNIHPRFFAWVQGTGTPFAVLADLMASTMNPNVAIGDHAAMYIDQQVIEWCKTLFNFPAQASGMLVSGGTNANITALTVARNSYDPRIREEGLGCLPGQLVLYSSIETHSCNQKAVEVLGIGNANFKRIPVDDHYRIDISALKKQIAADRAAGHLPFCIVGNAGTVNTGAIDPLDELLDICRSENLWFHIDGAFGALAKIVPEYADTLKAIEQADSLAFDLHKWMYLPYEVGCVLIRNRDLHRAAFALQPSYLVSHERGLSAGPDPNTNYGLELSRGFKALKVWMSIREYGIDRYRQLIAQNIAQCFYFGELIEQTPHLELLAPVTLNIVCYRYNPGGISLPALNDLNKEILMRMHEKGVAAPSNTFLQGQYAIRVANVNHRSRKADFEVLVKETVQLGEEIRGEG